jgi:hypothetical protein
MPLYIPLLIAALSASISILLSITHLPEEKLRQTGVLKFQPDKFQGSKKTERYFEGWYYKFVSSKGFSIAVVPGVFMGNVTNSVESHAFVFVTLNGERQHYYRFKTIISNRG